MKLALTIAALITALLISLTPTHGLEPISGPTGSLLGLTPDAVLAKLGPPAGISGSAKMMNWTYAGADGKVGPHGIWIMDGVVIALSSRLSMISKRFRTTASSSEAW